MTKTQASRVVLMALVFCGVCTEAKAANIYGAGIAQSCGDWLDARTVPDGTQVGLDEEWVDGYIDGAIDDFNRDYMSGIDPNAAFYWIDNWCRQNPTDTLYNATQAFLLSRAKTAPTRN